MSSGERKRRSPNRGCVIGRSRCSRGVVGPSSGNCEFRRELQIGSLAEAAWKGLPERVTAPYAKAIRLPDVSLSTTWKVSSCGNPGGPPSKAKYSWRPIVNQYREGKVKSTPGGE